MSPLKWAGSKRWLVPRLLSVHKGERLVEPFVGSMAVALGIAPEHALLADANPHLINFFIRLRDPRPFSLTMINDKDFYLAQRRVFNTLVDLPWGQTSYEAAEIFYFMNRSAFNGLCRLNRSGFFNVPFGKYETITYRTDFSEYAPLLNRWKIYHQPWQQTMKQAQAGDFVFADPPYDGTFDTYSGEAFSWEQQETLAKTLATHAGPVVATNAATDRVLALYRAVGFMVGTTEVARSISSNGNRKKAVEMIAYKNLDEKGGRELLTVSTTQT